MTYRILIHECAISSAECSSDFSREEKWLWLPCTTTDFLHGDWHVQLKHNSEHTDGSIHIHYTGKDRKIKPKIYRMGDIDLILDSSLPRSIRLTREKPSTILLDHFHINQFTQSDPNKTITDYWYTPSYTNADHNIVRVATDGHLETFPQFDTIQEACDYRGDIRYEISEATWTVVCRTTRTFHDADNETNEEYTLIKPGYRNYSQDNGEYETFFHLYSDIPNPFYLPQRLESYLQIHDYSSFDDLLTPYL